MYKRVFVWGEDTAGEPGWIMKGMPHFSASTGFGVAHDTLEHFDAGMTLEDELQAFGSMVYGRVHAGTLGGAYHTAEENLAADIVMFLASCDWRIRSTVAKPLNPDDEDFLRRLAEQILAQVESENPAPSDKQWVAMGASVPFILNWIRTGFHRAAKRWRSHGNSLDRDELSALFDRLTEEVDELTRHSDTFEGAELHVSVSPKNHSFIIKTHDYMERG